jgi:hypothetical protein
MANSINFHEQENALVGGKSVMARPPKSYTNKELKEFAVVIEDARKLWVRLCEERAAQYDESGPAIFTGSINIWTRRLFRSSWTPQLILHSLGFAGNSTTWRETSGAVISFLAGKGLEGCYYDEESLFDDPVGSNRQTGIPTASASASQPVAVPAANTAAVPADADALATTVSMQVDPVPLNGDTDSTAPPPPPVDAMSLTGVTPLVTHKASDIVAGTFKLPVHIVQNLLRPGYAVTAGGKSAGKTALALDIAAGIATGEPALGYFKVQQGQVLYVALEQSLPEMEELMVLKGIKGLKNIEIITTEDSGLRRLDDGGVAQIEHWIKSQQNPKAVFIDVLERWYTTNRGYSVNYAVLPALHQLGITHGVAIDALHHTGKRRYRDIVKEVLGDTGIVGTSGSVIVLEPPDKVGDIKLAVTGRLPSNEYKLEFNKLTLNFTCTGTWDGDAKTPERGAIVAMLKKALPHPMKAPEILAEFHKLGRKDKTLDAVKVMLGEMTKDGEAVRDGRGLYTVETT